MKNDELTVEEYDPSHHRRILDLVNTACKGVYGFNPLVSDILSKIEPERDFLYTGSLDGKLVSTAKGSLEEEGRGIVEWACCHPDYRGKGYATGPLVHCLSGLRNKGANEIHVERLVDSPYRHIISEVEANGFRVVHKYLTIRRDLNKPIPPLPKLPEEYNIRTYRKGDEETWTQVLQNVLNRPVTPDEFWNQGRGLGASVRSNFDPEGYFFAENKGKAVGICAGLVCPERYETSGTRIGILSWLGVVTQHRGKGLGRSLVTSVLRYLRSRGIEVCEGRTQIWRRMAVPLYEKLGFEIHSSAIGIGGDHAEVFLHRNAHVDSDGKVIGAYEVVKVFEDILPAAAERLAREKQMERKPSDILEVVTKDYHDLTVDKKYFRGMLI